MSTLAFNPKTLLSLVGITNNFFLKIRPEHEKLFFVEDLISYDIPTEYQENEVEDQKEYHNRFIISAGIISVGVVRRLIIKNFNNKNNLNEFEKTAIEVFSNILNIREKIIFRNQLKNNSLRLYFYDEESILKNNEVNQKLFLSRINSISTEIDSFLKSGSDIPIIRSYFGIRMGQILPEILPDNNNEINDLIIRTMRKIDNDLKTYFVNQI